MGSSGSTSRQPDVRQGGWREAFEDAALFLAPYTIMIGGIVFTVLAAVAVFVVRPNTAQDLWVSLTGEAPKVFWYLSRASSLIGFALLTASMLLGLGITNKATRAWPGGPTYMALHEHTALLGLVFALLHAAALLGDRYIGYSVWQLVLPFASGDYRPFWVGLGQVSLWLLVPVTLSYYVRDAIGRRTWRLLHYLNFGIFVLALTHGLFSGTDTIWIPLRLAYWGAFIAVLGLTLYRILTTVVQRLWPVTH